MTEILAEVGVWRWFYVTAHGQGFESFREEGVCTLRPMRNSDIYVIFFKNIKLFIFYG